LRSFRAAQFVEIDYELVRAAVVARVDDPHLSIAARDAQDVQPCALPQIAVALAALLLVGRRGVSEDEEEEGTRRSGKYA